MCLSMKFFIDRNFVDGLLDVVGGVKTGSGSGWSYVNTFSYEKWKIWVFRVCFCIVTYFYVVNFTPLYSIMIILYMSSRFRQIQNKYFRKRHIRVINYTKRTQNSQNRLSGQRVKANNSDHRQVSKKSMNSESSDPTSHPPHFFSKKRKGK